MHNHRSVTTWRRLALGAVASAALALTACSGGDDGTVAEPTTSGAQSPAAEASPAGDAAASGLRSCLEQAGFTVNEGSTPAELAESLGIEEQLRLVGPDEGVGSVTVYGSMPAAEEALASEQATENPGVAIGRFNTAVYAYAGGFESESAITRCLG